MNYERFLLAKIKRWRKRVSSLQEDLASSLDNLNSATSELVTFKKSLLLQYWEPRLVPCGYVIHRDGLHVTLPDGSVGNVYVVLHRKAKMLRCPPPCRKDIIAGIPVLAICQDGVILFEPIENRPIQAPTRWEVL